jgi:hypothetical protein
MRTIGCCIIVLVLVLMCVGIASANPGGGVKSSPLFKASLTQSIAKLDGKVVRVARAGSEDEDMPTGGRICPNLPLTQQTTCEPSWCGGSTCEGATCTGTCSETCWSTCSGSTCQGTCVSTCQGPPVNCVDYEFNGYVGWGIGSQWGFNWNGLPSGYTDNGPDEVWVYFQDGQGWYTIANFSYQNGYFDGSKLRPQFSGGAVVRAYSYLYYQPTQQLIYGDGEVGISGPLSSSSPNSTGNIWIYY